MHRESSPATLGMSAAMLLSCTAFEFGDPYLTPSRIWPGASDHSLHPSVSSDVSPRRRSLITATIYPLQQHQQYPQHAKSVPGSRFSFGTPFPSATVRVTRQGITIYRQSDRAFLVDVRWADVAELKRHTPAEEPTMTELAVVFARGIVVMDISSSHVAAGIWAALQHFHTLTDAIVSEELRRAAWGKTLPGDGMDAAAPQSPTRQPQQPEPEIVGRAKEILERFLGPHHNLTVTSPVRQQSIAAQPLHTSSSVAQHNELLSPSDSPHKASELRGYDDGRVGATSSASLRRRSASQLSARDRADELRREQDEQLQRIRRRESEMRQDIHHVASSSRATTPRSISTTSTAMGGVHGVRSDSPDVVGQDRRRRAAAAARSGTPSAVAPPPVPHSTIVRRAPLPAAPLPTRSSVSTMSAALMEQRSSISQSSVHNATEYSQPNGRLDELEYHALRSVQVSRMQEREELTSDIAHLMESLEDAERSSAAGASAQARRLSDVLRVDDDRPLGARGQHGQNGRSGGAHEQHGRTAALPPTHKPSPTLEPVAESAAVAVPLPQPVVQPVAQTPSPPLSSSPSQWVVKLDPQGKTYYVNPFTKTSTRKLEETDLTPAAAAAQEQQQTTATKTTAPAPAATPSGNGQPAPGWKTIMSDKGVPYYYHAPSKTTTWKVQETFSILAAAGIEIEGVTDAAKTSSAAPSSAPVAPPAPQPAQRAAGNTPTQLSTQAPPATAQPDTATAPTPANATVPTINAVLSTTDAATDAATAKATAIQTADDVRRENEARKQQAAAKVEEDKKELRFGNMSLAEALKRQQDALNGSNKPKDTPAAPASVPAAVIAAVVAPAAASPTPQSPSPKDPTAGDASGSSSPSGPSSAPVVYGDWRELLDKKTNRVYYRNVRTQAASWTVPEEVRLLKGPGRAPSAPAPAPATAAASPSQGRAAQRTLGAWSEKFDEKSQRYYYINSETKARTWKIEETPFAGSPPSK
jgi:hypothetical protein